MKTSTKKIVIIQFIIILLLSLSSLFINKNYQDYIIFLILLAGLFSNYFLNGFADNKYPDKRKITILLIIVTVLYQLLNYTIWGLTNGFVKNTYTLNVSLFTKIIIPLVLIIITSEILRHQMLTKGKSSTLIFITTTLLFIIVDLSLNINAYDIKTTKGIMEIIMIILLPSIIKNIFLSYVSFNYGYTSPVIYRLLLELTPYLIFYHADIPIYIKTIIDILLPFILLISVSYLIKTYKKNIITESSKYSKIETIISVIIILVALIFCALISGIFKYTLVAIGSNSMEPIIERGDAVIIEKIKNYDILKEGNIIIYKKENKLVIHRIEEIKKENDKYYFITKGDANKTVDNWTVKEEEIIGRSLFKIKNIGYPTIWLSDILGGSNG